MLTSAGPWKSFIAGGLLIVIVCGVLLWTLTGQQQADGIAVRRRALLSQARMLADTLRQNARPTPRGHTLDLIYTLWSDGVRTIVLDSAGAVQIDSLGGRSPVDLAPAQTEIADALRTGTGTAIRQLGDLHDPHVCVAVRHASPDGQDSGIVWLAQPIAAEWSRADAARHIVLIIGGAFSVLTLGLVLTFFRARRTALNRVVKTARKLSAGDITPDVRIHGEDELAILSTTLNALRQRLASQVELIDRQRRMLQSLVDQLQEGVIVARDDGRIALINPTAVRLLALETHGRGEDALLDEPVESSIPHHALQHLLLDPDARISRDAVADGDAEPGTAPGTQIEIETPAGTVHLLARAAEVILAETPQRTAESARGRVVMLTDITELQRTIQVRTDFVANASHELRTPLSTIRAAVETLLTMDLDEEAPAAQMFLEKIDRHSNRLQLMVADLLDLSRLETPSERFEPEELELTRMLQDLHTRFVERLERKQLHWDTHREPPELRAIRVNPHLLRLALDNLVDNAIKFTDTEGRIAVHVHATDGETHFIVRDSGCGIAFDEQQRVFERFYQVQRARSGPERGTGLGLSIVRHAVGAMRGSIELESEPGVGTTVTIVIPSDTQPDDA
jgi:signal transduction histidine kinase